MTTVVSVVVPVLADEPALRRLLGQIAAVSDAEILVVDGEPDGNLEPAVASRPGARLIRSPRGRARQMNAGASAATGDWLLFLHADSVLPDGWLTAITAQPPEVIGGWFRFALDDGAWQARAIERGVAWRVRKLRLPYGDQGFFVRRVVFERMGGYRDLPLMEDVEFVRRMIATGPVVELPLPLATSSRRYRQDGWARRSARNLVLITLYFAGVAPARLARWYSR